MGKYRFEREVYCEISTKHIDISNKMQYNKSRLYQNIGNVVIPDGEIDDLTVKNQATINELTVNGNTTLNDDIVNIIYNNIIKIDNNIIYYGDFTLEILF